MPQPTGHNWSFARYFRPRAFGPNAGPQAQQRIKAALTELTTAAKHDPARAASGAVALLAELMPALAELEFTLPMQRTVESAADRAVTLVAHAEVPPAVRKPWLLALYRAAADNPAALGAVVDRWGELCATPEIAGNWTARASTRNDTDQTALACRLAATVRAARHDDALALLAKRPDANWRAWQHGVAALRALGRLDDALARAENAWQHGDHDGTICEDILFELDRSEQAFRDHAVAANRRGSLAATFRAIEARYPAVRAEQILEQILRVEGDPKGEWLELALQHAPLKFIVELCHNVPSSPARLLEFADEIESRDPEAAFELALSALHWISHAHSNGRPGSAGALFERAVRLGARLQRLPEAVASVRTTLRGDGILAPQLARALAKPIADCERRIRTECSAAPPTRHAPTGDEVRDVLLAFAKPVLDASEALADSAASSVVQVALTAWNCGVFEAWGSNAPFAETAANRLRGREEQTLFERLLARKRGEFGHHQWAVGPCVLTRSSSGAWRIDTEVFTVDQICDGPA